MFGTAHCTGLRIFFWWGGNIGAWRGVGSVYLITQKRLMAHAELCTPIVRHSVGEIKSESMYQAIWSHP